MTGATRGWGWAAHLRAGGSTPWSEWSEPAEMTHPPRGVRRLPGAEVLELLRRLNESGQVTQELVERVLTTTAPGRGRRDLPLLGDLPPRGYGVAPVEPAALGPHELLRVAGRLIAEDSVAAHTPDPVRRRRLLGLALPSRLRRRHAEDDRKPYRLAGDPWLTVPLREGLAGIGRPEGGPGSTVYVVGRPLDELAADAWTFRCFTGRVNPWGMWLRDARLRDRLGPRADVVGAARRWAERVGPERVHIVTDPGLLPGLLEVDVLPDQWVVSAEATDLARVVGHALCTMVPPAEQEAILQRTLRPLLEKLDRLVPGGSELGVPAEYHDFLDAQARAQRDALLEDRYSFHGDPDRLLPSRRSTTGPDGRRALALALTHLAGRR